MAILSTCARLIVRSYPRRWRDRYEAEMFGLLDDGGATWRHVLDLAIGCGSEWAQILLRPGVAGGFQYNAAILATVLVLGLAVDLVSFSTVRLWHVITAWAPPASVADISRVVPVVTLMAILLSGAGGRGIRLRVGSWAFILTLAGAIMDRFRLDPVGLGYGVRSMLWIGIVLSWDELRRGPYRSRPPLGLSS
jgi:hypothetical protein